MDGSCKLKNCENTDGICVSDQNSDIICRCPTGTHVTDSGCEGKDENSVDKLLNMSKNATIFLLL